MPPPDTFGRVCARLDALAFEDCFPQRVPELQDLTEGQVIAIDGRSVRRSSGALLTRVIPLRGIGGSVGIGGSTPSPVAPSPAGAPASGRVRLGRLPLTRVY